MSGGCSETGQYQASLLHYDPKLEKPATLLSPMGVPRAGHVMAALGGQLYVAGGLGQTGDLLSFEAYDPSTGSWTQLTPLPSPHVSHSLPQWVILSCPSDQAMVGSRSARSRGGLQILFQEAGRPPC